MKTDLIIIPKDATLLRHEADWSKLLQQLYTRHKLVPRANPTQYPCWASKGSTEAADDDISEYATVHMQYYYLVPRVPRIPGVL